MADEARSLAAPAVVWLTTAATQTGARAGSHWWTWRLSPDPVPRSAWAAVERLAAGGGWVPFV